MYLQKCSHHRRSVLYSDVTNDCPASGASLGYFLCSGHNCCEWVEELLLIINPEYQFPLTIIKTLCLVRVEIELFPCSPPVFNFNRSTLYQSHTGDISALNLKRKNTQKIITKMQVIYCILTASC